jgi:HAD superfamily hydrolase (TIGR01509 family)
MDGVIVDSEPFHFAAEKRVFKELGIVVSEKLHHTFVGIPAQKMWEGIIELHHLTIPVESLIRLQREYYRQELESLSEILPTEGISDLLSALVDDGFSVALASSAPYSQISFFLKKFQMESLFGAIVSADDVNHGKPAPDIFLKTAEIIGTIPRNCVVIEDSSAGIQAAVKAKMKCIGFKNPNSGNQDLSGADMLVNDFDIQIIELIKELLSI